MKLAKHILQALFVSLVLVFGFNACTNKSANTDDGQIVLRFASSAKLKGLDPIYSSDLYSSNEVNRVYEGLLQYNYLKRPYILEPLLAEAMPSVSADGLTYTFKIRKGVKFHKDAAIANQNREVKASDFIYSFLRLADPKLQSTGWWIFEGRIAGLDKWRESMKSKDKTDYAAAVEGLKVIDDYTFAVKLAKPYPQLLNVLAMPYTAVVSRQAVEKYGKDFINHAVGTGPFILEKFRPSEIVTYKKNSEYWGGKYPAVGDAVDKEKGLLSDAGKTLPLADRVEVRIIVEQQPRWMHFLKGELEISSIPKDNFKEAITPGAELTEDFRKKGIKLTKVPSLDFTYTAFNLESTVVPQFKDVRVRRAVSLAITSDRQKFIDLFYNKMAVSAQTPVPPGIAGFNDSYVNPYGTGDLAMAKKLLTEAGYPDGKGFPVIPYDFVASTTSRQIAEFTAKSLKKIGLTLKINGNTWPEFQKRIQRRQTHLWGIAWGADYPDAENFLQLFYGPNATPGGMNGSYYKNAEFDKEFAKARLMSDSPVRTKIYEKLAQKIATDVPVVLGVHRIGLGLRQPWLKNYKYSEFPLNQAKYLTVSPEEREKFVK